MNLSEKVKTLKVMTGGSDTDEVLSTYLTIAGNKILAKAYPFTNTVTEVPEQYETIQLEIAAYLLNKRGAEGQTSHNENGIVRGYADASVPSSMLRGVIPCCGMIR